jgi:PEP-CTERM motif
LRSLFTAGALAVIRYAKIHGTARRPWLTALLARRPTKVAAIALANKLARMTWAMMAKNERYRRRPPSAVFLSSTTLFVDTVPGAGGQPNDLIVGSSPNGNASMASHSPYINGTDTFTLTAAGITDNSIISDVFFQFSTGQDPFVRVPGVAAVPEPATWAMMILGFLGVGLLAYRRKNGTLRLA